MPGGIFESGFSPKHVRGCDAVGSRPAGIGAGSIVGKDREWKSSVELDNTSHLPVADNRIDQRIQIPAPSLIAADGKFVNRVAREYVRNIVIAGSPLGAPIVEVLPVS